MTTAQSAVTVLGAGSYGTALAICFARNGHPVTLWGRNSDDVATLAAERKNQRYVPDVTFPESLKLEADLETAVKASKIILVVVPSHAFAGTLQKIKPWLNEEAEVAWATKGLEPNTGRLLQEVAVQELGDNIPLAVLSGPTFAKEMAMGLPTAISVSSTSKDFAKQLADLLHCGRSFRVYNNDDFIGIQLGGAVKNVIAIGAGMSDGFGFGANARTALITRGLAELCRLGCALGARSDTFMGMAGLGDLILTCTDNQSRNRRFGLALGKGEGVEAAIESIGQVVEGYRNTKEVFLLAERTGIEMPITEQIYKVLYENKDVKEAAMALLGREQKSE
ncbi:NAD(P)H-dependent glycerol-3-phosphate dehydrogenase [Pseudoalteromonas sp. SSMSWG5]|jgi:glycerol-3-phosphate dehydrogenase (NAD(P)+)|uniref:NAD(P)H-dependent glycerol-3-phosphate dehydrogenase n=1 Tax=Pseudoalteromonas TaxID=53246 RepID=UPI000C56C82B|nr:MULTISPECIES: NAD(P)H-dependent glycerol-3-phosphate dehydrogenase [unclassified Pseudoalteromonas]MBD57235.1 NAD(P)H-dependent glycerol-3-phosphate dehydrogenase [Pseudoalteromonas sp.]MBU75531.1 NAD(P)H-dependent glycerol-3-phosphate dehydrogenase [Pseudoalteromonadaceae bacterium]MCF2898797.1 NAD(P)H-dependent glycerol-3-phosphate dehydrogenase [Pseudoalteromonas sp. OFAV1]MCF2922816.1 NAD(P)H-dependent glycerol-3-phosphate dehydrogenase [Pseudoalteromonas sp. APAL1]MCO7249521.1 NAD(P)H-|tara:strand:+ start:356 stop:1363 length:1008 start_codon:yes stop_codon:yes gene_type:complete